MHDYLTIDLYERLIEEKVSEEHAKTVCAVAATPVELWFIIIHRFDCSVLKFVTTYFTEDIDELLELAIILAFIARFVGYIHTPYKLATLRKYKLCRISHSAFNENFDRIIGYGRDKINTVFELWALFLPPDAEFKYDTEYATQVLNDRGIYCPIFTEYILNHYRVSWYLFPNSSSLGLCSVGILYDLHKYTTIDLPRRRELEALAARQHKCVVKYTVEWMRLFMFSRSIGEFMKDDPSYLEKCYKIADFVRDEYLVQTLITSSTPDWMADIFSGFRIENHITLWGKWFESSDDIKQSFKGRPSKYLAAFEEIVAKVDSILKNVS